MITVSVDFCNPISQKIYDNVINSLQFHRLSCPCGHSGCLTVHGYYDRTLKSGVTCVSISAGSSVVSADIPMLCCFLPLSLIHRYPWPIRWTSLNMHCQMVISLPSWIPLLPLMRAVSVPSSDVSAGTGNSGFYLKISCFLSPWTLSDAVSPPSTDSSCRLKAPRIFYS